MLQPVYWDTWHTGTKLAMVSPEDVADAIIELYETPTDRDFILGKEQAVKHDLQWGPTVELFVELTRRAYALRGTT